MTGRVLRAGSAVAALAVALGLAGCEWRLETDPVPTPTADAVTATRDAAAVREQAVIDALDSTGAFTEGRVVLGTFAARVAPAHLDLLGGVYEPYPTPTPSPAIWEPATPSALRAAMVSARDGALREAFADSASPEGFLYGSMGFSHAFGVWWADQIDMRDASPLSAITERVLPWSESAGAPVALPSTTALSADSLASLAVQHDQARFIYEVVAARSSDQARADALARAALHAARGDALVARAGRDDRQPVYELPELLIDTEAARSGVCRAAEQALGWRYLELTWGIDADDRTWLMDGAFDAYAALALLPGFTLDEFPTLPGVAER